MRRSERCGCFWIILRRSSKCDSGSAEENCIARSMDAMDFHPREKATPAKATGAFRIWSRPASGSASRKTSVLRVLGDVPVHRRLVAGAAVLLLLDVVDLDRREVQRDVLGQAILAARAARRHRRDQHFGH